MMNQIEIQCDEKACVGCSLCVDECPTHVLEMDEKKTIPKVVAPKECFGCLSCSEICPATAITHKNVPLSECYYHDSGSLKLVSKLGTPERAFNTPDDDAHIGKALEDLGIRLLSVTSVLKQTLGQSLPSVGTMAGITLASQLPRYQPPQTREEALRLLVQTFSPAWEMTPAISQDSLTMTITACAVRDICSREKIGLGGDICTLFYNYFAGYLSKIGKLRPRLGTVERGNNKCVYTIKLYDNKS